MNPDTPQYSPGYLFKQRIIVRNSNSYNPQPYIQPPIVYNKTPERVRIQSQIIQQPTLVTTHRDQSPKASPASKPQLVHEDKLQYQLSHAKQQLQILQVENEILRTQQKQTTPQDWHSSNDSRQTLGEAVLRMEIEKLRFEIQTKERNINFLEERLRVEEEERSKINQMYAKRIDQDIHMNEQIHRLKEQNNILEVKLRQARADFQEQMNKERSQYNKQLQEQEESVKYLQDMIESLQSECEKLQEGIRQNERYYVQQMEQLQAEVSQLKQSNHSFESQRQYFEEEMAALQRYYDEILRENEMLHQRLLEKEETGQLSPGQISRMAEAYLNGEVQDLEILSIEDARKVLQHFRDRLMSIVQELKGNKLHPDVEKDIQEIKTYKMGSYPSKRGSSDIENQIRILQDQSDELLGEIEKRKEILTQQFEDINDPENELMKEVETLYQQYQSNQVQIQFLLEKQKQFSERKRSSVSFDQSFDVQNNDI